MPDTRNRQIFWFCLPLATAIALTCVGIIILYDFYVGGGETPGRVALRPGSGLLAILMGAGLLALLLRNRRAVPPHSRTLILVGTLGILITTIAWHTLRLQYSENLSQRAQALAGQVAATSANAYDLKLALIRRLAEHWELLGAIPSTQAWQLQAAGYLRDFPELRLLALLDPGMDTVRAESRAPADQSWLEQFLKGESTTEWLRHVVDARTPHLSSLVQDSEQGSLAAVAVPLTVKSGSPRLVMAVFDLQSVYQGLTRHYQGPLKLTVSDRNRLVFDTAPDIPPREKIPLASAVVNPHHDTQWRVDAYIPRDTLPSDEIYLPPLILMTGLGLSFLAMLTHLFWRESEHRSAVLHDLNNTLNYHLEEERGLRHTNQKIMEFSRDLLCSVSGHGKMLTINPACEAVLGYTPAQLKGMRVDELLLPEDRDSTLEALARVASGHNDRLSGFHTRLRHREGHTVTIAWTAEWSEDDQALFCVGRDITDELVAETLTRERDRFFSLSPDMFCIVDLNGHFFELNDAFVKTLGYPRESLLGAPYLNLVDPDDHQTVVEAVTRLTQGSDVQSLFIRAVDAGSGKRWLQINAILGDDDLVYVVARDITDELATQERLKQSEALLRIAERTARIGGWNVTLPSGTTIWTSVMFELFDLPVTEAPDLDTSLSYFTGQSRDIITSAISQCSQQGIPFDEEAQFRTASGQLRWARVIGQAVRNDTGEIIGMQGGFQDITATRQAMEQIKRFAERQATIFESITDAFLTLDRDWRFTYMNRRSEEILRRSRNELLGHSVWEMFPEAVGSRIEEQYRHAVATGESVSFETYYAPLDNWLEISAYPSEEGLAVYYRSIRERKEAERQLQATLEELERSNRDLQDFAFVASHDLQEPLRKIQAFSDRLMMRSSSLSAEDQDYLARMQSAADRMQLLIRDLLSYSRVTSRARAFDTCDAQAIMEHVLQDMEAAISEASAHIELTPLPPVTGDATQLRQVFQNLISNAIKFREADRSPVIEVYPENLTPGSWTLVVSDNGVGFDPKYSNKIFHPFQRLHQRSSYGGTGIGMAIVKKILDRHGASIEVRSAPGQGTTFRIHFRHKDVQGESRP